MSRLYAKKDDEIVNAAHDKKSFLLLAIELNCLDKKQEKFHLRIQRLCKFTLENKEKEERTEGRRQ